MTNAGSRIAPQYMAKAHDGTLTFVGVLRAYFDEIDNVHQNVGISKYWKSDRTRRGNIADYERRLVPGLAKLCGAEKAMHEYVPEDVEKVLADLSQRHHYEDSTREHYRHLFAVVYNKGVEKGLYADQFHWVTDEPPEPPEKESGESRLRRLKKSFSIEEEISFLRWMRNLKPERATGQNVGLVIMYLMGLRENELCGLNYGVLETLHKYPDVSVLSVVQTTKINSAELKAGGKTSNAPRILPICIWLELFLNKRKAHIQKQIQDGELKLPDGVSDVNQLPIVCVGSEYTTRAMTKDLTDAGHRLFERVNIRKKDLVSLSEVLFGQEIKDFNLEEKDPTTYMIRRNHATRLNVGGFTETEKQYWAGHEIEDSKIRRAFFASEDMLKELSDKYRRLPVIRLLDEMVSEREQGEENQRETDRSTSRVVFEGVEKERRLLKATACEPGQAIDVHISADRCVEATFYASPSIDDGPDETWIQDMLYEVYRKAMDGQQEEVTIA